MKLPPRQSDRTSRTYRRLHSCMFCLGLKNRASRPRRGAFPIAIGMAENFKRPYLVSSDLKGDEDSIVRRHFLLCGMNELFRGAQKRALFASTNVTHQAGVHTSSALMGFRLCHRLAARSAQ